MAKILRGTEDDDVRQVKERLDRYESEHAGSEASLYRQNGSSIRVRIIDDRAAGMNRSSRHREAWRPEWQPLYERMRAVLPAN